MNSLGKHSAVSAGSRNGLTGYPANVGGMNRKEPEALSKPT